MERKKSDSLYWKSQPWPQSGVRFLQKLQLVKIKQAGAALSNGTFTNVSRTFWKCSLSMLPSTLTTSHVWLLSLCLWLEDWELYFLYYVDLINWNVSLSSHIWLVATINMLDNAVLQHFSSAGKNTSTDSATTYTSILPMETSKGADPPFFCFSSLFHPKEVSDENAFLLDFYCCWNKWLLTEWLPTTQVSSLRFLETRSPQGISLGLNQSVGRTVFFWRL